MILKIIHKLLEKSGYIVSKENYAEKYPEFFDIYQICRPFTMTSIERMYSLYKSVEFISKYNIEGDFVECGVWKGGSSMLVALSLIKFGLTNRKIYMYDTYEGMSEPTDEDKDIRGITAARHLNASNKSESTSVWCYSNINEVKANMAITNYPSENIKFIKGKVEDTIPTQIQMEKIAILRLDTDWYESTKHELIHLYPKLTNYGILIIDDYGHWVGAKKAVDEYIEENNITIFLQPIDYTGRIAIKL